MAEPPRDVRHVLLPWARLEAGVAGDNPAASDRVKEAARALRIHRDRLAIRKPGSGQTPGEADSPRRLDLPPLLTHGLPFKPHPSIPDEDRVPWQPDALLSAAVALDILATLTRPIGPTPAVLTELTEALLHLGRIGGMDRAAVDRLVEYAASAAGNSRASLSRYLSRCMAAQPPPGSDEPTAVGAHGSTPRAAGRALRRIEVAADAAIQESRLRLEAREVVEYKQA